MNFSKTGTKAVTFGQKSDLLQIYIYTERETNIIFEANGFEFYEVFQPIKTLKTHFRACQVFEDMGKIPKMPLPEWQSA